MPTHRQPARAPATIVRLLAAAACLAVASAAMAQQAPAALPALPDPASRALSGRDGWLFFPGEIRHLATAAATAAPTGDDDPLPAILHFHRSLAAKGIRLVIVPVPEKSLIRADKLFAPADLAAAAGYARASAKFTDALTQSGVDVLDLRGLLAAEVLRAGANRDPVYCKTDSHYTPRTTALMARAIANHLREVVPALPAKPAAGPITGPQIPLIIQGDLAESGSREQLAFTPVIQPAAPSPAHAAPVLLLGDSHCLVFHAGGDMLAKGGGLADHLGVELGCMPDVMAVRGSGATAVRINLFRKLRKEPAFLAGKKAVIWCFAAREFTQSDGWKIVPLP